MWDKKMEAACLTYLKWPSLVFFVLVFPMPIIWVICSSLKNLGKLPQWPPSLFGKRPPSDNCIPAAQKGDSGRYFINTAFVSVTTAFPTLRFNTMAGYTFAKYGFKGAGILFGMVPTTLMVPLEIVTIPIFKVIVATNLYNSSQGLITPTASSPAAASLIRRHCIGIPDVYIGAARIDGASESNTFMRIMLPPAKPVVSVLRIFSLM